MTTSDPVTDEPEACPYLGLPDDRRTRFTFAAPAHRCYAGRKPTPIDLGHQGVFCLSSAFPTCNRFPAPVAAIGTAGNESNVASASAALAELLVALPVASVPPEDAPPEAAALPEAMAPAEAAPPPVASPDAVSPPEAAAPPEAITPPEATPPPAPLETVSPPSPTSAPLSVPPVAPLAEVLAEPRVAPRWPPPPAFVEPAAQSPVATLVPVMAQAGLNEAVPAAPVRRQPWLIETRPVYDTRNRIPDTAPLAARARAAATVDRVAPLAAQPIFASKRNVRVAVFLLLVALALGALAVAFMIGSLARPAPASSLPGGVVVPSATVAATQLATSPSLAASTTPTAEASPGLTDSPAASPTPSPTAVPTPTAATQIIHIVRPGEFLSMIAAQYGVTPQAIARANHLKDYNHLRVGQKLIIPLAH